MRSLADARVADGNGTTVEFRFHRDAKPPSDVRSREHLQRAGPL
jgi:hypothetical protein